MSTVAQPSAAVLFEGVIEVSERHFGENAERLVACAAAIADRFFTGGRLLIVGDGPATTDAQHNAVEFIHPALPGCRALPAISFGNDVAAVSSLLHGPDPDLVWAHQVELFGRPADILLAFADAPLTEPVRRAMRAARERGILSVLLGGATLAWPSVADHQLLVVSDDRHVVKQVNLATYHMLWELVHIVLNHRGIPGQSGGSGANAAGHCITCADTLTPVIVDHVSGNTATGRDGETHVEVSIELVGDVLPGDVVLCHGGVALQLEERGSVVDALYPMLTERPAATDELLRSLAAAPTEKARESNRLRAEVLQTQAGRLAECAAQIADRVHSGGTLHIVGNGGSAAAAAELAALCVAPPPGFRAIAALALTNDIATVTAVGNDVGFADIFTRQLMALAREGDVVLAFSTSGSSENLVRAVEYAGGCGVMSVAVAGYDGGRVAQQPTLDHSFVVPSNSVHRIQEVQATIAHTLWRMVHANLGEH